MMRNVSEPDCAASHVLSTRGVMLLAIADVARKSHATMPVITMRRGVIFGLHLSFASI